MTKNVLKKIYSVMLILSILAGLCSCAKDSGEVSETPDAQSTLDVSGEAEGGLSQPTADGENAEASYKDNSGIPLDTVVLRMNGKNVYWEELRYWLYSYVQYAEKALGELNFDYDLGGITVEEYVWSEAIEAIKLYYALDGEASEMGITLSQEDTDYIEEMRVNSIESMGGEEAYYENLESSWLTENVYKSLLKVSCLYYDIFNDIYGENAEALSDEKAIEYGESLGLMQAKHILIMTVDENRNPLSDEQINANYEKAQSVLSELKSAEDQVKKFDELIGLYGEDPGMEVYTDGYLFGKGEMVTEFEEGVLTLNNYEISDIVASPYGYHIIMRLPINPESTMTSDTYGYTLRYNAAMYEFDSLIMGWEEELEVEYMDVYYNLELDDIFRKTV